DPLARGVRQPQRTPRLALDDPPAHSRTQIQSQIAARAASDQLRPPLQQLRIKCARSHLVAGVKFQVYCPSRSCPHCVHSGAHASDDPGRPQDPSKDAVSAGRWLADQDGLAVASIAGTLVRSRPLQAFCPVAPRPSPALGPPCTLQAPLHRARVTREAKDSPARGRKLASTIERAPWLSAVATDIAPGTDHSPYRASSPSTRQQRRQPMSPTLAIAPKQPTRTGWALLLTSVAFFMVTLDSLVVVTALPAIHRELGGQVSTLEWAVNAYLLVFAAGIITAASIGERFGRRRVYVAGLALFSVASAACALAPSTTLLIAARAMQGLGAAIVTPLSLTILTTAF